MELVDLPITFVNVHVGVIARKKETHLSKGSCVFVIVGIERLINRLFAQTFIQPQKISRHIYPPAHRRECTACSADLSQPLAPFTGQR